MISTMNKKIFFLLAILCFNALSAFPLMRISGLVQYGDHIDRERLELLEDRHTVRLLPRLRYETVGRYTIRNIGDAYQAKLGILFHGIGTTPFPLEEGIQFFVEGQQVHHTEREYFGEFVMGETVVQRNAASAWALIEITFPENSIVTVEVRYVNRVTWRPDAITLTRYLEQNLFPGLSHWNGQTAFSVTVINDSRLGNRVEYFWIGNIEFHSIHDNRRLHTMEYLRHIPEPETNLMRITRVNENTFTMEFTGEFLEHYQRGLTLHFVILGGFFPPFIILCSYAHFIVLGSFYGDERNLPGGNISERKLGPYEFIFFTNNQLRVMRNAFFAQYGFIFTSEELATLFRSLEAIDFFSEGYIPNPNFHEGMLTDIDRANIAIIQRLEALVRD